MEATARGIPRSHSGLWPYAQRGSEDAARNTRWSEAEMGLTPWRSCLAPWGSLTADEDHPFLLDTVKTRLRVTLILNHLHF